MKKKNHIEKSIVSMGYKQCVICNKFVLQGKLYIQANIINEPQLDPLTIVGYNVCDECKQEDYIPFVVAIKESEEKARTTGEALYVPKDWAERVMGKNLGDYCLISPETAAELKNHVPPECHEYI